MTNIQTFYPRLIVRISAGLFLLGAIGFGVFLAWVFLGSSQPLTREEWWMWLLLEVLCIACVLYMADVFRRRVEVGVDQLVMASLFRRRVFMLAELGGYCRVNVIGGAVVVRQLFFYDRMLKKRHVIPLTYKDGGAIERWFAQLPEVEERGSLALPNPRFKE